MLKSTHKLCILFTVVVFVLTAGSPGLSSDAPGGNEWKMYKEEGGIKGYEREVKDSKFIETRADILIEAPLEVVLEVLMDVPAFPTWMYGCTQSTLLEKKDQLNRILYFVQDVPWPAKNQAAVIQAVTSLDVDNGGSITDLKSIAEYPYEEKDSGIARMIEFRGRFDLRMLDRNRTSVIYTAFSHPSGFAPKGIAKRIIRNVSFETIQKLTAKTKEKAYAERAEIGPAKKEIEKAIKEGRLKYTAALQ